MSNIGAVQIGKKLRCRPERGEVRSERVTDKDRKPTLRPEIKVVLSAAIDSVAHSCDVTAKQHMQGSDCRELA